MIPAAEREPASDELILDFQMEGYVDENVLRTFLFPEEILEELLPMLTSGMVTNLCKCHPLSAEFIERNINYVDWLAVAINQPCANFDFIKRNRKYLNWPKMLEARQFTMEELRELAEEISHRKLWPVVAEHQALNVEFLEEFKRKLQSQAARNAIALNQPLTFDYVTENILKLDLNKVVENKKVQMNEDDKQTVKAMRNMIEWAK